MHGLQNHGVSASYDCSRPYKEFYCIKGLSITFYFQISTFAMKPIPL